MISDLSVVVISISVIVLCWAIVRVNQKIDEAIRNPKINNQLDPLHLDDATSPYGSAEHSAHRTTD